MVALTRPATPRTLAIARELLSRLSQISALTPDPGDSSRAFFFYTVDKAAAWPFMAEEFLEATRTVQIGIVPERDRPEELTAGQMSRTIAFWVLAAYRYKAATMDPNKETKPRLEYADELAHDVERCIQRGPNGLEDHGFLLGGLVENTELQEVERGWLESGWVTMFGKLLCTFNYEAGNP